MGNERTEDVKNSSRNNRNSRKSLGSVSVESKLQEERDLLINARRNELDQVVDEHDDMVRYFLSFLVDYLHEKITGP